jgi:hypothetical protein
MEMGCTKCLITNGKKRATINQIRKKQLGKMGFTKTETGRIHRQCTPTK